MDRLDKGLLRRVAEALGIEFKEWQVNYILDIPMLLDMAIMRRGSGKTLAYIVKLLFSEDKPIRAFDPKEVHFISDDNCFDLSGIASGDSNYVHWFRKQMLDIHARLTKAGLKPRPMFVSIKEYNKYMDMIEGGLENDKNA